MANTTFEFLGNKSVGEELNLEVASSFQARSNKRYTSRGGSMPPSTTTVIDTRNLYERRLPYNKMPT